VSTVDRRPSAADGIVLPAAFGRERYRVGYAILAVSR
jgi:hypothetical protein